MLASQHCCGRRTGCQREALAQTSALLAERAASAKAAGEAAERANRAKGEFISRMSHELRTPLNAILGFSEILKGGLMGPLNDRYRDYAGDIHGSGQYLLRLISDMLDK